MAGCTRSGRSTLSLPMNSRRFPWASLALPVALAVVLLGALSGSARAQAAAPTDPAAQQIDIGSQWFRARCLECHEKGDLTNENFQVKWGGRSAFDLYDFILRTMPENEPGGLTRGTYTAIVAYLMKLNGMPTGSAMLSSDSAALSAVRLTFARNSAKAPSR